MAGIMNNTARQYNLKTLTKAGNRIVARIVPGFNVVDDEHWNELKNDEYVIDLKKQGVLDFGEKVDDQILEIDPPVKSKSKSEPKVKSTVKK